MFRENHIDVLKKALGDLVRKYTFPHDKDLYIYVLVDDYMICFYKRHRNSLLNHFINPYKNKMPNIFSYNFRILF